eukprot:4372369-Amphidinium_carterae.2
MSGNSVDVLAPSDLAFGGEPVQSVHVDKGDALICKLLQYHNSAGYLLKGATKLFGISFVSHVPLQSMSRTTGQCLANCMSRLSPISVAAEAFQMNVRGVSCDSASYNICAERMLVAQRGPNWLSNVFYCDVHAVAGIHEKCFEQLFAKHTSGLLHTALSLRVASAWGSFKQAVLDEIHQRPLHIIQQAFIPPAIIDHKKVILHLFFYDGSGSGLQQALQLLTCFNGDWECQELQFYWNLAHGEAPDSARVRQLMVDCARQTLISSKPNVWPRSRWTGFRSSLRDIGLFFCLHNMMPAIYKRFMKLVGHNKGSNTNTSEAEISNAALQPSLPGLDMQVGALVFDTLGAGLPGDSGAGGSVSFDNIHSGTSAAARNSKDRTVASDWIDGSPWALMLLTLVALKPLDALPQQHFWLASLEFEQQEQAKMMSAALKGEVGSREYRLGIAASGKLEKQFTEALKALYEAGGTWAIFPEQSLTLQFNVQCFVLLSRLGTLVQHYLASRHQQFPCQMFTLIYDASAAAQLSAVPPCLKDSWSKEFQSKYPTLTGEACIAALTLQATMQKIDISMVESLHASIRRQVVLRSCQTWCVCLKHVSANWMLQSLRRAAARSKGSNLKKAMCSR